MTQSPPARLPGPPPLVWAIALIFCAIEGAFQLADAGLLPWDELRWQGYVSGAFWDLYFEDARQGLPVPAEFWSSFLTHAFLHGNMMHLLMNTAIFLGVGGMVANLIGPFRFLVLFAVTAVAGALTFGLIAETRGPCVGASGVVFGLFGALKAWEWRYIRRTGAPANRFWGTIVALVILNVVLFYFLPGEGSLAWEAHLGGFAAGFMAALGLAPRLALPSPI